MTKPFKVEIPEENLQNIYSKVKNYQWHEMPDDGGWDYGTNLDYMKDFSKYWVEKYNWRKTEEKINKFNNFKLNIDAIFLGPIGLEGLPENPNPGKDGTITSKDSSLLPPNFSGCESFSIICKNSTIDPGHP